MLGRLGRSTTGDTGQLVVFDGDDTLWRTQELYDQAKREFATVVRKRRPTVEDPVAVLDRIDAASAQTRGFTVDRFVDSMLQAYRELAVAPNASFDWQADELHIRSLAAPLVGEYSLYPDAVDALKKLQGRFTLVLATKGDAELQQRKIAQFGLNRYFNEIYVMHRKTEHEYSSILHNHQANPESSWAVGNSVRSDINPALRLGMRAVWIQRPTWLYEEAALEPGDVVVVHSLGAAVNVILARTIPVAQH